MRIKNISPFGDLEVGGLGLVPVGAEVDVDDEVGASLLEQSSNFKPVDEPKPSSKSKEK